MQKDYWVLGINIRIPSIALCIDGKPHQSLKSNIMFCMFTLRGHLIMFMNVMLITRTTFQIPSLIVDFLLQIISNTLTSLNHELTCISHKQLKFLLISHNNTIYISWIWMVSICSIINKCVLKHVLKFPIHQKLSYSISKYTKNQVVMGGFTQNPKFEFNVNNLHDIQKVC